MKTFIFCLLSFGCVSAFANPICFTDLASYEQVKSKLPASMQKGSIRLGTETKGLVAAVQIAPSSSGFNFQMAYRHWIAGLREEAGRITKICVSGNQAIVTLASGTTKKLAIQGNGFSYDGNQLDSVNSGQFQSLMKQIKGGKPGGGGSASKGQG